MIVEINVNLKHGVLDPQAKAIHQGLKSLGFCDVAKVSLSKRIMVEFGHNDAQKALSEAKEIAEELLANTVIEDYCISLKKD